MDLCLQYTGELLVIMLEGQISRYTCVVVLLQYSIEHYFTQHQKTRLMLFGIPLVVPCVASSTGSHLYHTVWTQVKRLIIPDPPPHAQRYLTVEFIHSHSLRDIFFLFSSQTTQHRGSEERNI